MSSPNLTSLNPLDYEVLKLGGNAGVLSQAATEAKIFPE